MIGYYKPTIIKLLNYLKIIKANPYKEIALLLRFQQILIKRLKYIESKIRFCKHKNQIIEVNKYREILFFFKQLGDCLVYLYLDRHDIKPLRTNNSSGFITGKSGFKLEQQILQGVISKGVPCILADLTNELRHGDAYVFIDENQKPLIFEIKSNKKLNQRSKRQIKRLQTVVNYLETDEVDDFFEKGTKAVRLSYNTEPYYHLEQLNKLIEQAYKKKNVHREIEPGLHYIVSTDTPQPLIEKVLNDCKKPFASFLNSDKFERKVYPYLPIQLSINDPDKLFDFFNGKLFILVIIDLEFVVNALNQKGFSVKLWPIENHLISMTNSKMNEFGFDHPIMVSVPFFGKVIFEFLSLKWMLEYISDKPEEIMLDLYERYVSEK